MSNTNTVPSAEEVLKQKDNGRLYHVLQAYRLDEAVIEIMEKYTRLHLEAMRDEKYIKSLLEGYFAYRDDRGDRVFYDYNVQQLVIGLITTYIKNNKL